MEMKEVILVQKIMKSVQLHFDISIFHALFEDPVCFMDFRDEVREAVENRYRWTIVMLVNKFWKVY